MFLSNHLSALSIYGIIFAFLAALAAPLGAQEEQKGSEADWRTAAREADLLIAKARRLGGAVHARKAREVLDPWWDREDLPPRLRLQRATLLQRDHHFEEALADLNQLLARNPRSTEAWLMKTTVLCVSGRYPEARKAASPLFALASPLLAMTAGTAPTSCNGLLVRSYEILSQSLEQHTGETESAICWARTALAEMAVRMGEKEKAHTHFQAALRLDPTSPYLLKNYANFLVDTGEAAKAIDLISGHRTFLPVTWMRACRANGMKESELGLLMEKYEENLKKEYAEHGHSHGRDEAIYFLEMKGDVREAMHHAAANWESQREAADLIILVKSALAADDEVTLAEVREWIEERDFEDVRLEKLLSKKGS